MKAVFLFLSSILLMISVQADPGDTTIVQTFTWEEQNNPGNAYDYPGRRFFTFPENDGTTYQKVLMYYNLKCFEDGTAGNLGFPCGEWDYLSYTYLYESTGELDSTALSHPRFLWDNSNFDEALISDEPVSDTYQYFNTITTSTSATNEQSFVTPPVESVENDFFGASRSGRSQFVWTAEELTEMGLTAGDIHKISIPVGSVSGEVKRVKIRIRQANMNALSYWNETNWQTVYDNDTEFESGTEHSFLFSQPFSWNGTADLSIDLSYTNYTESVAIPILCTSGTSINGIYYSGTNLAAHFNNRDQILAHIEQLEQLNTNITIAFWMYGDPAVQPQDGTAFEAVNSTNGRVFNAHTPWGNGRIYWDCGNDNGAYDRIDKLANETQYEGKWNHWVFTKDASIGVMRMFVNGSQFHAATGLDNTIADIVRLTIGSASGNTNFYRGALDEFVVFNATLPAASVSALMTGGVPETFEFSENILLYHRFDNADYSLTDDHNPALSSYHLGSPERRIVPGDQVFNRPDPAGFRPIVTFYRGDYEIITETATGTYTWIRPMTSLVEYSIEDHNPISMSRTYHYPAGYRYTFSPEGTKLDSAAVAGILLSNETLEYYSVPFEIKNRYELGRFITPYGINLTLGSDGWTWIYDVTDFEPLLHGEVELEAGNWQELLDLKFVFIEGPEVREVKRIVNVWNGDYALNTFDQNVTAKTLVKEESEEGIKLRTTVTGHGFGFDNNNCGEFCYNTHSIAIDGDTQWSWEIMEDCDRNPLYPQGGTWIYARAGWCPGKEGTIQEFELTPFFNGDEISVDYNIEHDPFGNYVTESQAIFYGPILQSYDLEIERVIAPSNWKIDSRSNPMCDNPVVVIRNRGSQPVMSATISFRVDGGETQALDWTGNLNFMESAEVELTYTDPILWQGSNETLNFIVDLSQDENHANNHAESKFKRPPVYSYTGLNDNRMIVIIRTNAAYQENSWTLYDMHDEIIAERAGFDAPNTFYRDTLSLNEGCYKFVLRDTDGDGLGFFANSDGTGQAKLDRVGGIDFKVFNADFGREIIHYFYFATDLVNVSEQVHRNITAFIYPNPVGSEARLRVSGMEDEIFITITSLSGKIIAKESVIHTGENDVILPVKDLSSGMYLVSIHDGDSVYSLKMIVP